MSAVITKKRLTPFLALQLSPNSELCACACHNQGGCCRSREGLTGLLTVKPVSRVTNPLPQDSKQKQATPPLPFFCFCRVQTLSGMPMGTGIRAVLRQEVGLYLWPACLEGWPSLITDYTYGTSGLDKWSLTAAKHLERIEPPWPVRSNEVGMYVITVLMADYSVSM